LDLLLLLLLLLFLLLLLQQQLLAPGLILAQQRLHGHDLLQQEVEALP
jgi:hypothetical protein